jgi:hypothetical protein
MTTTVATAISEAIRARNNRRKNGDKKWQARWEQRLTQLEGCLPSGSGVDSGTKIELDVNNPEVSLAFVMNFHHMTGDGMYDGWTKHIIYVTATFGKSFVMRCAGRDKNNIKDYLCEILDAALGAEAPEHPWLEKEATQ